MAFNLKAFLLDIIEIAPALVSSVLQLKNETPGVSKTQLAADSLRLATGVSHALTSNDPVVQTEAAAASIIVDSIVHTVAKTTGQTLK
ncbi:MAG TPA: hypothetical protein VHV10_18610 [Ktedonobacteraceae bacterium]|jgi:hypothetical protein|nr:hypothetical protein [Ktedonobacteraceae bacterium]